MRGEVVSYTCLHFWVLDAWRYGNEMHHQDFRELDAFFGVEPERDPSVMTRPGR